MMILFKALKSLLLSLLTERAIIRLVIGFGDWLVKRTTNELDDKAWTVVKEELEKSLG